MNCWMQESLYTDLRKKREMWFGLVVVAFIGYTVLVGAIM